MDRQNVEARPRDAERPQASGAASPGRGGRMSQQQKPAAVLRLLRGEDLRRSHAVCASRPRRSVAGATRSWPPARRC